MEHGVVRIVEMHRGIFIGHPVARKPKREWPQGFCYQRVVHVVLDHQVTAVMHVLHQARLPVFHTCVDVISPHTGNDGVVLLKVAVHNILFAQLRNIVAYCTERSRYHVARAGDVPQSVAVMFQVYRYQPGFRGREQCDQRDVIVPDLPEVLRVFFSVTFHYYGKSVRMVFGNGVYGADIKMQRCFVAFLLQGIRLPVIAGGEACGQFKVHCALHIIRHGPEFYGHLLRFGICKNIYLAAQVSHYRRRYCQRLEHLSLYLVGVAVLQRPGNGELLAADGEVDLRLQRWHIFRMAYQQRVFYHVHAHRVRLFQPIGLGFRRAGWHLQGFGKALELIEGKLLPANSARFAGKVYFIQCNFNIGPVDELHGGLHAAARHHRGGSAVRFSP